MDGMDVRIETAGDTTVAVLVGELDAHTCDAVGEQVVSAVADGARDVVVDLSGVSFLDSSGLRVLVRTRQEVLERGGRLRLRGATDVVERVLQITGLAETFERA